MSRWLRCCIVLLFVLVVLGAPLFADINQSVLSLLTKLSRDYVQYREEVFFKIPLAVVPFVNSSPLAKQHEIGAVVDELIRSEISNSTYFILTERENLEKILEEIELSLSDFSDASQSVEVGQLTSAKIILAGSVTESGASFLLNGRLIDVETGVVIGAESVPVPKDELITEAEAFSNTSTSPGTAWGFRRLPEQTSLSAAFPVPTLLWTSPFSSMVASAYPTAPCVFSRSQPR